MLSFIFSRATVLYPVLLSSKENNQLQNKNKTKLSLKFFNKIIYNVKTEQWLNHAKEKDRKNIFMFLCIDCVVPIPPQQQKLYLLR